ncbi:uncharacterized protein C8Q71DRAFT_754589 [Rhodofomes roseus]|uniref:BTB domain-containing protein n=1 Tax=Rhodofomes roseus TaxID=34475 RepID=A0ABQ8KJ09_9APHY|nr:uncharacterized protein C8Q71DRAFT_754589 [Rhodofomes roseus]KAH9837805.1 hypothetical protein C8Q71DRAFT_754589 [Rhodofomes roseus]
MSASSNPQYNERFCAADADITVSSSDGVLFRVHRNNLGMHSDIFPGSEADAVPVRNEVVTLTEKASTLELLFQFMYRQRQPDLNQVSVQELVLLAEAAEKYCIYSAMGVCKIYVRGAIPAIPMQVLVYAARHGYNDLCDEAAHCTVDIDAAVAMRYLDDRMFRKWILYRESRLQFLLSLHRPWTSVTQHEGFEGEDCDLWLPFMGEVLQEFRSLSSVNGANAIFNKYRGMLDDCHDCQVQLREWENRIMAVQYNKLLPNFTSFGP